jgi:hypothetical protein
MNWALPASLDQIWRSPSFPMWLTLAAAAFFGLVVLVMVLRADRSVANTTLAVLTLISIAVAGTMVVQGFSGGSRSAPAAEARYVPPASAALPQLSCIDDLAGDAVLSACEKALFGSAESAAAAVAYAANQITLLISLGDVATANKGAGSDLMALRRAVERDRYGLMAYVLTTRDRCTAQSCPLFRSLTSKNQIAANMDERLYESLVTRYAPSWNAPPQAASGLLAGLPPSMPTGKPTNAEFPTSASTPAISIMNPEPPLAAPKPPPAATAAPAAPRPAAASPAAPQPAQAAAKKPPPPPPAKRAPVQLAPTAAAPTADNNE